MSGDVYAGFINDFSGTTGYYGYTNLYVKAKVSDFFDTYYRLYYYMGYLGLNGNTTAAVSAAGVGTDWYMASTATILSQIYVKGGVAPRTDGDWFAGIYATPNLGFGTLRAEAFFDGNKRADGMGVISTDARLEVPLAKNAIWGRNIVNDLGGTTTSASQDGGLYVRLYAPF